MDAALEYSETDASISPHSQRAEASSIDASRHSGSIVEASFSRAAAFRGSPDRVATAPAADSVKGFRDRERAESAREVASSVNPEEASSVARAEMDQGAAGPGSPAAPAAESASRRSPTAKAAQERIVIDSDEVDPPDLYVSQANRGIPGGGVPVRAEGSIPATIRMEVSSWASPISDARRTASWNLPSDTATQTLRVLI
ncbi:MAG: hypothetical protein BWX47_01272 [candidate division Hyd24-12 bacterium ADurb.Bin004]|nr:MAG: hypothetical protein BWX47_01272 [candidate division Hyd24-12 bacterium ADurb.Bin004]